MTSGAAITGSHRSAGRWRRRRRRGWPIWSGWPAAAAWRRAGSERMYRWLLRLYPASFRHEYGHEMQAVFARQQRDARTAAARVVLWLRVGADTCVTAALVHGDILAQDLHYTVRALRRTSGFALTALALVSLGIGATTAAFSVADFV